MVRVMSPESKSILFRLPLYGIIFLMAMKCFKCGKGVMYGHRVSHAKNRTNRIFKPNLHNARILVNGAGKRVRLCTKCLRRAKKPIYAAPVISQASL